MTSHQTTASQFAADRLANFQAGNIAALMDQYHADASVITPNGVLRGRDQIRGMIEGIIAEFSQSGVDFKLLSKAAEGEVVTFTWQATTPANDYKFAAETYVLKEGLAHYHVFGAKVAPR
jgi:ketosteroid isomerase-like protein